MLDLKRFREDRVKTSLADFAIMLDVSTEELTHLEQFKGQLPLDILVKIANVTGKTIDELNAFTILDEQQIIGSSPQDSKTFNKESILAYLEKKKAYDHSQCEDTFGIQINELHKKVSELAVKPRVIIAGHPDVQKSLLVNNFLDTKGIFSSWISTNAIAVHIKHIEDKPSYIKDEAWIFCAAPEHSSIAPWDEHFLYNERYNEEWKLAGGDIKILEEYNTNRSEDGSLHEAGAAMLFIDSDILKNCDILVLPCINEEKRLENKNAIIDSMNSTDILMYIANSLMCERDIDDLIEAIGCLRSSGQAETDIMKPLANLFIIDAQPHTKSYEGLDSLSVMLDQGYHRLAYSLSQRESKTKENVVSHHYDEAMVRSRIFTVRPDTPMLQDFVLHEFYPFIEQLSKEVREQAKAYIRSEMEKYNHVVGHRIDQIEASLQQHIKDKKIVADMVANEPYRSNTNFNHIQDMLNTIDAMKSASFRTFTLKYEQLISEEYILSKITSEKIKPNKTDLEKLNLSLIWSLQSQLKESIDQQVPNLTEHMNNYLEQFQEQVENQLGEETFNATEAFLNGLNGLSTFGGVKVWAVSLGDLQKYAHIKNFGKLVGGRAVISKVLSGPVVLITAIVLSIAAVTIINKAWQKKIAREIVKRYDQHKVLFTFKEELEKYWEDTLQAFKQGADALDAEWKAYSTRLKNRVDAIDQGRLEYTIRLYPTCKLDVNEFLL
ncbi:helix-turn-helix transcriptional regulator [Paenibacillus hunanensis]|uniref:helix-turn-helix domain-containing protein n=1 Tax=Paenibacillus hunanensis TaxID=539262 RepID=UPI0020263F7A|nr:helix-turn-helix transcriptional regulator [Paenibacillus hunanensis]MCL9662061.1 helix-turn-helix transcriptional regulator [Paenibacillus hunanensis]